MSRNDKGDQEDALIQTIERNEGYRRLITTISEAGNWEYKIQCFGKQLQEKLGIGEERAKVMEWGKSMGEEQDRKDKQVHFGKEPLEETQTESTHEPKVSRLEEVRTGRGSARLQGTDEKCLTNETCRKRKGKGNGQGRKGETGNKGALRVDSSATDEDQENTTAMTSEEKERHHKKDVRKLVEMVQKEEMEHEEQRGRMAPNMGASGSHSQATSGSREEEAEERRKRGPR